MYESIDRYISNTTMEEWLALEKERLGVDGSSIDFKEVIRKAYSDKSRNFYRKWSVEISSATLKEFVKEFEHLSVEGKSLTWLYMIRNNTFRSHVTKLRKDTEFLKLISKLFFIGDGPTKLISLFLVFRFSGNPIGRDLGMEFFESELSAEELFPDIFGEE